MERSTTARTKRRKANRIEIAGRVGPFPEGSGNIRHTPSSLLAPVVDFLDRWKSRAAFVSCNLTPWVPPLRMLRQLQEQQLVLHNANHMTQQHFCSGRVFHKARHNSIETRRMTKIVLRQDELPVPPQGASQILWFA